jgi:hemerythrin-like domain-containing protein
VSQGQRAAANAWDETTRPTGPPPDPTRTYSEADTARGPINTMTMRQNNWTLGAYCQSYCRLVTTHHTLEDIALLARISAADPRLTPVTDRLAEEHVAIHGLIEELDRALIAFVTDPSTGDDLRAAVDRLSDSLLSHLSYEERELVEPVTRLHIL